MSNPSLFVSPLVCQAARNLHTVEWLSGNDTWRFNWLCRRYFWRTRRMMARTPDEAAAWLPALAFAVSCEKDADVLAELARQPLPEPLPPEAIPWRAALIRSWERQRAATSWGKTVRLAALVRLDRRAERLPEWLREARRALDLAPENRHLRLAALASWRPRPGDAPPHGDKAEAAQAWVRFWEERYRTPGSGLNGLIAATALLHLAEAGWLPSGPSPEQLREELRQRVRQCPISYDDRSVLRMLLSSIPADISTPERWRRDVTEWLELTHENVGWAIQWERRKAVWDLLAAWQRESVLERCGIDGEQLQELSLLPDLARALECEEYSEILRAMAGYIPGAVEVSAHPEAARAVVARWEVLSRSSYWETRSAAWVARWNLRRAGALTAEEQGRFGADYMEAIGAENDPDVLLTLAQITPPGTFPLAIWTRRLSDQDGRCRLAARLAIHGWLVEVMEGVSGEWRIASGSEASGGQRVASGKEANSEWRVASESSRYSLLATHRRQMRQVLRRAGQEGTDAGAVAPFVNLPPEVLPDFRRLHEIETALAAGQMPPPDADIENQPMSRAGLARLPEAHPRTGLTDSTGQTTGRTAGSEPSTRHPFPEVICHE